MKLGGTAALAGLAYKVYSEWQASKQPARRPDASQPMKDVTPPAVFLPQAATARADMSLAVLRAMIAAAKADGHIDAAEQQKIFGKLDEMQLGIEDKAFVVDELAKPLDIDAVVAAATTPELAVEIYAASVLAIDADDPAEQAYLGHAGLAPETRSRLARQHRGRGPQGHGLNRGPGNRSPMTGTDPNGGPTLAALARESFYRLFADEAIPLAGNIAFRTLFSIFPFLIFLTALAGFFGNDDLAASVVSYLLSVAPHQLVQALEPEIRSILTVPRTGLLSLSAVLTIWSAMGGRRQCAGGAEPRL